MIGNGFTDRYLTDEEVREIVREGLRTLPVVGKRVLIIIPDGTRTMPMPLMSTLFDELLAPRAAALDYLVALGTHPPMTDAQLSRLVGRAVIGGLSFATVATLLILPLAFSMVQERAAVKSPSLDPDDPRSAFANQQPENPNSRSGGAL